MFVRFVYKLSPLYKSEHKSLIKGTYVSSLISASLLSLICIWYANKWQENFNLFIYLAKDTSYYLFQLTFFFVVSVFGTHFLLSIYTNIKGYTNIKWWYFALVFYALAVTIAFFTISILGVPTFFDYALLWAYRLVILSPPFLYSGFLLLEIFDTKSLNS